MALTSEQIIHALLNSGPDEYVELDAGEDSDGSFAATLLGTPRPQNVPPKLRLSLTGDQLGNASVSAIAKWFDQATSSTTLEALRLKDSIGISDLSPLSGLAALKFLYLVRCTGVSDLSPLSGLAALERLDLRGCTGVTDLSPLSGLAALERLDLTGCTGVSDLSPLSGLAALVGLDLTGCTGVSDLSPLSGLAALEWLDLTGCTGVSDLSPLSGLAALEWLDLSGCTGVSNLSPLSGLSALAALYLNGCIGISDLRPLSGLSALSSLDLQGCLGVLDVSPLTRLSSLQHLYLLGCGATAGIDPALLNSQRPHDTIRTVLDFQRSLKKPLNECRIFLVGEPHVGKTSLQLALCDQEIPADLDRTLEVVIKRNVFHTGTGADAIAWHVWDFGGQEFMHATHRCYFTSNCVFLLLMDPRRKPEGTTLPLELSPADLPEAGNRLTYWRRLIAEYAPDAPVIAVRTRCNSVPRDEDKLGIIDCAQWSDPAGDRDPIVNILKDVPIDVDCPPSSGGDPIGIDRLKAALIAAVDPVQGDGELTAHVRGDFPQQWIDVRKHLLDEFGRRGVGRMPLNVFMDRICGECKVDSGDGEPLLQRLNNLGEVIYYAYNENYPRVAGYVFSVEWVNTAVYSLIHALALQRRSSFVVDELYQWLPQDRFPDDEDKNLLLEILQAFKLAFAFEKDRRRQYCFPALLASADRYSRQHWLQGYHVSMDVGARPELVLQTLAVQFHKRLARPLLRSDAAVFQDSNKNDLIALFVNSDSDGRTITAARIPQQPGDSQNAQRHQQLNDLIALLSNGLSELLRRHVDELDRLRAEARNTGMLASAPAGKLSKNLNVMALLKTMTDHYVAERDRIRQAENTGHASHPKVLNQSELAALTISASGKPLSKATACRALRGKTAEEALLRKLFQGQSAEAFRSFKP